jgi:hypothetical protein
VFCFFCLSICFLEIGSQRPPAAVGRYGFFGFETKIGRDGFLFLPKGRAGFYVSYIKTDWITAQHSLLIWRDREES